MEESYFYTFIWIWTALAIVVFPIALFVTVPYGRHTQKVGLMVSNKIAWIIMESPALLLFVFFFLTGSSDKTIVHWVIFSLFVVHYFNRTYIWPFKIRSKNKKMPVLILVSAFFFNVVNGFINGYFLGNLGNYTSEWMLSIPFIIGSTLFVIGFMLNVRSDNRLIRLRKVGEKEYKIPTGGLFDYISCPNIFGEIIEWSGWAILTWSLPTLSFLIWSVANLLPRALDHHKWYNANFENYPKERKAIFPFLL